jgi:hypothetical protein
MKLCKRCNKNEKETLFYEKRIDYCKICLKWYYRRWAEKKGILEKFVPIVTDTSKQCCMCKETKPLEEYSNSTRGRKGKSAYCKPCNSKIQLKRISKEERRANTQKYRDNNKEWWRSLHRINQFNRRNKIKLVSDGTITQDFIKQVYSNENCYYCKDFTPEKFRTLEHKQPLNKGGLHSSINIVMCCFKCNSTKRDMTEKEFINYLKQSKCELVLT